MREIIWYNGFMDDYILSEHAKEVIKVRDIKKEWLERTLEFPSLIVNVAENETHYFASITEKENRCLKVVINPLTRKVITVYFDRNMRKRGCR